MAWTTAPLSFLFFTLKLSSILQLEYHSSKPIKLFIKRISFFGKILGMILKERPTSLSLKLCLSTYSFHLKKVLLERNYASQEGCTSQPDWEGWFVCFGGFLKAQNGISVTVMSIGTCADTLPHVRAGSRASQVADCAWALPSGKRRRKAVKLPQMKSRNSRWLVSEQVIPSDVYHMWSIPNIAIQVVPVNISTSLAQRVLFLFFIGLPGLCLRRVPLASKSYPLGILAMIWPCCSDILLPLVVEESKGQQYPWHSDP